MDNDFMRILKQKKLEKIIEQKINDRFGSMSSEIGAEQKNSSENEQMSHSVKKYLSTEIDEEFICTICMDVMKNPLMIDICEHIFCGDCIKNCISHNGICPNDRIEIREANLKTPFRSFLNLLGKLDIKCEFTALGCNEIVKLDRLNNHMENCRFNPLNKVECICGEIIDKVIADEHKNNCVINLRYQLEAFKIENETLNKKLKEKVSVNKRIELKINPANAQLFQSLKRNSVISDENVVKVMSSVDRGNYCTTNPYIDKPQSIGVGVNISAPHMHARSLELFKLRGDHLSEGSKVLDVGSGSGYMTACMAIMTGETGIVIGIDHNPILIDNSIRNIKKDYPNLIDSGRIKMIVGDGRNGYAEEAPYDAIYVGAASPQFPQKLVNQLKPGGRIIVPIGEESQKLEIIDKLHDGTVIRTPVMSVIFGSLTDRD